MPLGFLWQGVQALSTPNVITTSLPRWELVSPFVGLGLLHKKEGVHRQRWSECREGGQLCREKKLFTFLYAHPVFLIHSWKDTIILCNLLEPLMPRRHVSKGVSLKNFHECDCFTCLNQQTLQHSAAIASVTCPGWIENCLLTLDRDSSGTLRSDAIQIQTDEVSILLLLTDIRGSKAHHHWKIQAVTTSWVVPTPRKPCTSHTHCGSHKISSSWDKWEWGLDSCWFPYSFQETQQLYPH